LKQGRPPLKAAPVVEALKSLNGDNVLVVRSTTSLKMELVKQAEAVEVRAAFHAVNWNQRQLISRALADVVAASCGVLESDLNVCEAIQLSSDAGHPVFRIELPEKASQALMKPAVAGELERALKFLSDGHLTSLSVEEFAKEKDAAAPVVAAVRKMRAALPGRKLSVDLQLTFPAWKGPIVVPKDLCEPEAPAREERKDKLAGRISGFDVDDRRAHFRESGKASCLDLSFDEQRLFEQIYKLCARRTMVTVHVTIHLENGRAVSHEIDRIDVIQDALL